MVGWPRMVVVIVLVGRMGEVVGGRGVTVIWEVEGVAGGGWRLDMILCRSSFG